MAELPVGKTAGKTEIQRPAARKFDLPRTGPGELHAPENAGFRILDRRERMKTAHRHRSDLAEAFAADRVAGPGSFEVQRLGRVGDMVRLGAPA